MYCDSVNTKTGVNEEETSLSFELKPYAPANLVLQDIARDLKTASNGNTGVTPPWLTYLTDGMKSLTGQSEHEFKPPPADSDKLYMSIGERDVIEVAHPAPQDNSTKR